MKTIEYCDLVKEKLCIESHYALAKCLDISKQSITKLYGGGTFSPSTAVKVAAILEIDPLRVIADSEIEKAKNRPAMRVVWEQIAARAAVAVFLGAGIGGIMADLTTSEIEASPLIRVADSETLYIMLNSMASHVVDFPQLIFGVSLLATLCIGNIRKQ